MSFSRLQSIFKSPFYHLPDNATVQVLISSNSLILLCFLNTFQGTQESQRELRETKSTEIPLPLLHIFNKSFHYKWHEWVEATLKKKKKRLNFPQTCYGQPIENALSNGLETLGCRGEGSDFLLPVPGPASSFINSLPKTFRLLRGFSKPHGSHVVWHEASYC